MQELKNKKILIADDEKELLGLLSGILNKEGYYNIYTAESCAAALDIAQKQNIALYLLDVNFPDGDGFSLFSELRTFTDSPVIFLTARGEAEDRVTGLGLGADDYIVKPFLAKELVLRVGAVLRRTCGITEENGIFTLSGRIINFESATVSYDGECTALTAKEFILLKKLWENKNRIVTNDALCMAAWGDEYYGYENTLMVHIRHLRKKIENTPSAPKHLLTIKGLGHKLVIEDE